VKNTTTVRKVVTVLIFVFLIVTLLSLGYAAASIMYGESSEDVKLPKFLGNRPANVDLLKETDAASAPFSFFVVGDTKLADFFPSIYRKDIRNDAPDFGLILGDFVKEPKIEDHRNFMMDFSRWGVTAPVFLVCGNHDIVTKEDIAHHRWYSFTLKDFERTYGPADFSFTYHGCLFIVLDDIDTDSHVAYLAEVLSHRSRGTLMTFVFTHIPAHTISPEIKSREMLGEKKFLSLVEDYNVDYVISGDFHSYFSGKVKNTNFIISGGGTDKMGNNARIRKEGIYQALLLQVNPVTKDVAERIYVGPGRTDIWQAMKKTMLTQVFAFFESQERWEAPILSSAALLSVLLGVWGFAYAVGGRRRRTKKRP
jgi:predicted phosphodiesterase